MARDGKNEVEIVQDHNLSRKESGKSRRKKAKNRQPHVTSQRQHGYCDTVTQNVSSSFARCTVVSQFHTTSLFDVAENDALYTIPEASLLEPLDAAVSEGKRQLVP